MRRLAQFGLGARGVTYLLLAWLVLIIALHRSGHKANDKGAFETLAQQPSGRILLGVLAAGFAAYALWRLAVALGLAGGGKESKKIIHRLGALGQTLVYGFLCYLAAAVTIGASSGGSPTAAAPLTARLMTSPAGRTGVIVAGAVVVIAGIVLAVRGGQRRFEKDLKTPSASPPGRNVVVTVGVIGTVTRGLVVILVGVFLLEAGLQGNAARAKGLDASLLSLRGHFYGTVALVAVALGAACFGVFSLLETGYRRL